MTTGGMEILVVMALAILLFGPKKLPEIARTLGEAMGEYHKATRTFENEMRKTSGAVDKEISSVTTSQPKLRSSGATPPTRAPEPKTNATPSKSLPAKTPTSLNTKTPTVTEIAKNLGIETANKNENQLLKEISLKTKKKV
jgi:TatA/E family protein of Tat protein translocase